LLLILFILTEAVPVFIALTLIFAISEILTIKQYKNTILKFQDLLCKISIVILLICFGTMITCPVITAGGILYLCSIDKIDFRVLKKLL
ncbi:MAG: hypothetical protein MJ156_03180, partial [Alphaproteobacteria bacterium]|nr:hypothetical protein [Alphaproteobacteria bacterium]